MFTYIIWYIVTGLVATFVIATVEALRVIVKYGTDALCELNKAQGLDISNTCKRDWKILPLRVIWRLLAWPILLPMHAKRMREFYDQTCERFVAE